MDCLLQNWKRKAGTTRMSKLQAGNGNGTLCGGVQHNDRPLSRSTTSSPPAKFAVQTGALVNDVGRASCGDKRLYHTENNKN